MMDNHPQNPPRTGENQRAGERRAQDRRRDPMSDEAVEQALLFLNDFADKAGKARADVTYMENFRKMTLARLRRAAPESSNDAKDNWARVHPDYIKVVEGQREAVAFQEKLFWQRTAAPKRCDRPMKTVTITTKAWQAVGIPMPAGGLHTEAGARALVYTDLDLRGNKYVQVGLATVTLHLQDQTDLPTTTKGSTDEQHPAKSL